MPAFWVQTPRLHPLALLQEVSEAALCSQNWSAGCGTASHWRAGTSTSSLCVVCFTCITVRGDMEGHVDIEGHMEGHIDVEGQLPCSDTQ